MSVICITGASAGIGRATAELFAKNGWHVVAMARRKDRLTTLCEAYPNLIHPVVLDISKRADVEKAFANLPAPFATLDVLLNNAGLALGLGPAHEASLDDWDIMVDTNIKGLLYATHAVLPSMVARKAGHIINMGSIAGTYAYAGSHVYGASKAFVALFSKNIRCDMHGTGVRVTNIEPGLLESEFSQVRFKGDTTRADSMYVGAEPLRPEHVAESIFWAVQQPACVDITALEVMPTCQSLGATRTYRPE